MNPSAYTKDTLNQIKRIYKCSYGMDTFQNQELLGLPPLILEAYSCEEAEQDYEKYDSENYYANNMMSIISFHFPIILGKRHKADNEGHD